MATITGPRIEDPGYSADPSVYRPASAANGTNANGTLSPEDEDGFAFLRRVLDDYGLSSLYVWARQQIIDGRSIDWILLELRNQRAFRQRFALIFARQQAGLAPMSPDEVVAYETQVRQVMRAAGLPPGFYDQPDDFVRLGAADVSVSELADRINEGYLAVSTAHQSVRAAFQEMFGPSGDAALAAMFLDPDRALPTLLRYVGAAEFKGAGSRFGFDVDKGRALEAASLGIGGEMAQQGFMQLDQIRPVFEETLGEVVGGEEDLAPEDEGLSLAFGLGGGEGAAKVRKRKDQRTAAFAGNSGLQATRSGVAGLGSAD